MYVQVSGSPGYGIGWCAATVFVEGIPYAADMEQRYRAAAVNMIIDAPQKNTRGHTKIY